MLTGKKNAREENGDSTKKVFLSLFGYLYIVYSQNLHLKNLAVGSNVKGTVHSVPLICVCMGEHMSDLKGVFENAFVVLLFWKLKIKAV